MDIKIENSKVFAHVYDKVDGETHAYFKEIDTICTFTYKGRKFYLNKEERVVGEGLNVTDAASGRQFAEIQKRFRTISNARMCSFYLKELLDKKWDLYIEAAEKLNASNYLTPYYLL